MATSKKKPKAEREDRTLAFLPRPDKWEQRADATVDDAPAQYVADLDGVPPNANGPWVIRQRVAGKPMHEWPIIHRAPGAHGFEVENYVAVLNRTGGPTLGDRKRWGILKKAAARREPFRKHPNHSGLTVVQWIDRLYVNPKTSAVLQDYAARKRLLGAETLRELLDSVDEQLDPKNKDQQLAGRRLDREFTDKLIAAISIKLWEKIGIHRANDGRWDKHNDPSSWDDGTDPDA
jgi:hypothetical protein